MEGEEERPPLNISRDFVSERDVEAARVARDQAFELARRLNPLLTRPVDDPASIKPLHVQLAANKAAKQEEWDAQHAFKNQIYTLQEEDIAFVQSVREQEAEHVRHDRALVDEFKGLVRAAHRQREAQIEKEVMEERQLKQAEEQAALAAAALAAAKDKMAQRDGRAAAQKDVQKTILSSAVRVKQRAPADDDKRPAKVAKTETKQEDLTTQEAAPKTAVITAPKAAPKAAPKQETTLAKAAPSALPGMTAYGDSDDE